MHRATLAAACAGMLLAAAGGCAYRVSTGPLQPQPEAAQAQGATVADDGSVSHAIGRLEVRLRPMQDEELNRQFPQLSDQGNRSGNPYTHGNWTPPGSNQTPSRFTVFLLEVDNYEYPKVLVDPLAAVVEARNGRRYEALSFKYLREYYYPYNRAYAGNSDARFENRKDILKSTMFPVEEPVFAGQQTTGYLVFPVLHDDVTSITVRIPDIALRFDYRDLPVETTSLEYRFQRTVERLP